MKINAHDCTKIATTNAFVPSFYTGKRKKCQPVFQNAPRFSTVKAGF